MEKPVPKVISDLSREAHEFSVSSQDKIGFLIINTIDMTKVATDGTSNRENLQFSMRCLESNREITYQFDQKRVSPDRRLVYGFSSCISSLAKLILHIRTPSTDVSSQTAQSIPLVEVDFSSRPVESIAAPLPTSITDWCKEAHDFALGTQDEIKWVIISTMELARVALDGKSNREDVEFALRSLETARGITYQFDKQCLSPLRHFIYGLSFCVSSLCQTILHSSIQFQSAVSSSEDGQSSDSVDNVAPTTVSQSIKNEPTSPCDVKPTVTETVVNHESMVNIPPSSNNVSSGMEVDENVLPSQDSIQKIADPMPPPMTPVGNEVPMESNDELNGDGQMETPLTSVGVRTRLQASNKKLVESSKKKGRNTDSMGKADEKNGNDENMEDSREKESNTKVVLHPSTLRRIQNDVSRINELKEKYGDPKQTRKMICTVEGCLREFALATQLISHHYYHHKTPMWEFPAWISCNGCSPTSIFHTISDCRKLKIHKCDPNELMLNYYSASNPNPVSNQDNPENIPLVEKNGEENEENGFHSKTEHTGIRSISRLATRGDDRKELIETPTRKRKLDDLSSSIDSPRSAVRKLRCDSLTNALTNLGLRLKKMEKLECPVCKECFTDCRQLSVHVKEVHPTRPLSTNLVFKCKCGKHCRDPATVGIHLKEKGSHEFEVLELVVDSLDVCEEMDEVSCEICKESMTDVIQLANHLETSHDNVAFSVGFFVVCSCNKPFIESKPLLYHLENSECTAENVKVYAKKKPNLRK